MQKSIKRLSPRVEQVLLRLEAELSELKEGERLTPVREMLDKYETSMSTLQNALAVLVEQGRIERRHGSGTYASKPTKGSIVPICINSRFWLATGGSPFWALLMNSLVQELQRRNCRPRIMFSQLDESIDPPGGSPLVSIANFEATYHQWLREGHEVIGFSGPGQYRVGDAVYELFQRGMHELVNRGAKKIAVWVPGHFRFQEIVRSSGLILGNGIEIFPGKPKLDWVGEDPHSVANQWSTGYRAAMTHFGPKATEPRPDAILLLDDMMTQSMLTGLEKFGIKPGRDVLVATHSMKHSPALVPWLEDIIRFEYSANAYAEALADLVQYRQTRDPAYLQLQRDDRIYDELADGFLMTVRPKLILPTE
jgi:DNA-binding transcriptional regulator YhcF (GntR family)